MAHAKKPTVSLWLDKRRKKKDGGYPVKMQVYHSGRRKHYSVGHSLIPENFDKAWNRTKPRGKLNQIRKELQQVVDQAEEVINKLPTFSFEAFEEGFFETPYADGHDVFSLFDKKVADLKKAGRNGSADSYDCAQKAIKRYLEYKGKLPKRLFFEDITTEFLEGFEKYLTEVKGRAISTVGVYVRQLRAIFNDARERQITSNYPFGRRRYKAPAAKKTKKALSFEELKKLNEAEPKNKEQEQAKDFWLLAFCLYGINLKDLAQLRNKDLTETHLTFYRGKTIKTSKENLAPITIPLTEKAKGIIEKYKANDDPESFVLNIIHPDDPESEKRRKIQVFNRFINQHIKILAANNGLPSDLSYQWSRHSFSTLAIRQGASMEFVSEALGHSDIKTTKSYFAGFDKETGKELMEKLTDF